MFSKNKNTEKLGLEQKKALHLLEIYKKCKERMKSRYIKIEQKIV
jgi:hypothetical protein